MAVTSENSPDFRDVPPKDARYWAVLFTVTIVLILPILAVRHPPLVDYPNHLARAFILRHYGDTPVFRQNYELHLAPIPNLALDFVIPLFLHRFSVIAAGRMFLVLTVILFAAGCHLLGKAAHQQPTWLALPCVFFVYSVEFLWGFMNFVFGLALFLICLALWLRWRAHWTPGRLGLLTLLVTSTYFAHLMDYAFTALAISVMALWYWSRRETGFVRASLDVFPVIPPAFVFIAYMQRRGRLGSVEWDTLARKAAAAATVVLTYHWPADAALLAGFLIIAIIAALVVLGSGRVQVFRPLFVSALVFLLLYLVMPYKLLTGSDVDNRFVPAGLLLLVLSLRIEMPRRAARWLLLAWLVLSVVRLGVIWDTWRQLDKRTTEMIEAFSALPVGSRIYPAPCMDCETKPERGLHHAILYATIYRDAFVPSLLALESQEVIQFRRPAIIQEPGTPGWTTRLSDYDFVWSYVIPASAQQDLERCCKLILQGNGFGIWEVPKESSNRGR
ncbi:MAG TPA: hypothetical protein VG206_21555 [Terriglobia bacterium]|nr:hypothetical protein [Terriglobia bacterium]